LRSEWTTLLPLNTGHRAEIIDMNSWYWSEVNTDEQESLCFGFRVSHDKDNYAFQGAEFGEFKPHSGIPYETVGEK
jgi:hypothetical protein